MTTTERSRTALVTGGTSGIGRAVVERLRHDGYRVAFTGRDEDRGIAVAAATGAAFIRADITDRAIADRALDDALAWLGGRIDVLVNNAAIIYEGSLQTTPDDVLRELFEVNLTAPFRYSRACFAIMREQRGGSIVYVASDTAIRGIHRLPVYSASKAALVTLSELYAAEGAPHGIRCNAICPGATHPGMRSTAAGFEHHAEDDSQWGPAPSGRHGQGSDVAAAVSWLVSDEAEHVSGATLRLDGAATVARRGVTRA